MSTTRFIGTIVTVSLLTLAGCTSESRDAVPQTTRTQTIITATATMDPTTPRETTSLPPSASNPDSESTTTPVATPTEVAPTQVPGWDELPPDQCHQPGHGPDL